MSEEWLPVVGYEGYYEVSNKGRVRSIPRTVIRVDGVVMKHKGRLLKLHPDDNGYPEAILSRDCKCRTIGVHVLVCTAFNGTKPEWAHGVRHLNGIPGDNSPENLAWGTHAQNMQDKDRHGTNFWKNQTECRRGHKYTPGSYYIQRNGRKRACKRCRQINYETRRDRLKGAA